MAVTYNLKGTTFTSFQIGKQGITVFQGTSAPTGGTGQDGDLYVQSSGEDFYQKVSGTWFQLQRKLLTTVSKTANYSTTTSDRVIFGDSSGGAFAITLATATVSAGRLIEIKDADGSAATNNITIDTEGSETIDGNPTIVIDQNFQALSIISDGTNWFII